MKRKISILFLILLVSGGCASLSFIKPRLAGPVITPEGVVFQYYAPSARTLNVAGDFNNWESGYTEKAVQLKKNADGVWSVTLPLKPGRYKYKFVVDNSKWENDPNGESAGDPDNNSLVIVE